MIILPLLSIFGLAGFFANIFKTRFTFSLPIVTTILVAILTLCSVTGILYYATCLITIIGIVALIYDLYKFAELRSNILQYKVELCVLTAITLSYYLFLHTTYLNIWDDLAFWAVYTKELISYNDIFPQNSLTSILPSHIHYPRGPSIFHYFMLYFPGYSENDLLLSHFILQMLFLAPLMANKYFVQTILLVSLVLFFPVQESFVLRAIYNDGLIAFIFSSVLVIFILEDYKYKALLMVMPILLFMPLFREVGLWLSWFASIMIFCNLLVDDNEKLKSLSVKIGVLIILLILPFLTNYLWFMYVKSHVTLGREPHSLDQFVKIVSSLFNKEAKTINIISSYINIVFKALGKKSFLCIYGILLFTGISIHKYKPQYLKSFLILVITAILCFIIFLAWRLYLYIVMANTIYSTPSGIDLGCVKRYASSYGVIFMAISCAYLKKTLFYKELSAFSRHKITKILITAVVIIFTVYVVSSLLVLLWKMPKLSAQSENQLSLKSQTPIVYELLSKDFQVDFDFDFDNNYSTTEKTFICYKLAYFLTPYFNNEMRSKCISQPKPDANYVSEVKKNQIESNINIQELLEDSKKYQCNIKYYPIYNNINIKCAKY
ncbi:hypothetical protein BA173_03685 [Rickettsia sp. MEAM1 (Bemisia tabaci)]|uniref:hypothetical protein n=1 Tax=unclassified Rickettsia TaxID=114295 RepID=UPI00082D8FFC|nr:MULTISPECIES: hypothetical protein [unclassified Rickettsia]ASX27945.1 hypothetical protein BA173_03685 [Rickettsia sp. MEAM1 (Bemisia tabaci)]ODA38081.1 hypothetical protein A8V33_00985 [Rickettsia sp. wb]